MKKIILLGAILFGTLTQAQNIAYTTNNGATIENNQVFTFNTVDAEAAKLLINLKNNGTETFRFKIRVDEVIGNELPTLEMGLQFCFSTLCYTGVVAGNLYPNNPVALAAGQTNDPADHFLNTYGGTNGAAVTYKFTVVEVNEAEEIIQDNLLKFTYIYQPTASISDFTALKNIGISLNSTVVKTQLDVTANTAATLQLFDANGKKVKTATITEGNQSVDLSALSSGIYFADFKTTGNKTANIKIVKN
ncbi:hypothetical protein AM493_11320 [Flavobacterium akiainvivens]|uniref:Secretion system C-terminal sorting domain-containing protein n=1 Tax=Flavobacterium akiainvivens TaxID=1202724 RepID=A0A0M9VIN0_9FLAO|nr:T9SS type A sorting domain-containing protein [Flavobacterium akiainvivens]KOS06559.1 hypothetical protein AM493_11320 [Flavobacterium akiainvivens]SFQ10542.1 Por secretion system C-terminal sorting domain-containing protein [Flavobacterium akiainvivens]